MSANADGQQVENYLLFLSLSDTVNEMRAALQQKEAELNLRASEHNAERKQNDEKMRYELELLSKAKTAEMDQVLAANRQKEQEYESLIHEMDARLKVLAAFDTMDARLKALERSTAELDEGREDNVRVAFDNCRCQRDRPKCQRDRPRL